MTPPAHEVIVARLAAVGVPAYPMVQPAETGFPACVYSQVSAVVERALEGDAEVYTLYNLDFRARTYAELVAVVDRAAGALKRPDGAGAAFTLSGVTDLYDDEVGLYRRIVSADVHP